MVSAFGGKNRQWWNERAKEPTLEELTVRYNRSKHNSHKPIEIEWDARKKISDYFKQKIKVKWHILGLNDAEVEVDGKKVKTNKGELKLTVDGILERDYEETWEKSPTNKFLRGIYDKYIIKTTIDEYEDRLFLKANSFFEDTKAFLALEGKK